MINCQCDLHADKKKGSLLKADYYFSLDLQVINRINGRLFMDGCVTILLCTMYVEIVIQESHYWCTAKDW